MRTTSWCSGLAALMLGTGLAACVVKNDSGGKPPAPPQPVQSDTPAPAADDLQDGGQLRLPLSIAINDPALVKLDLSDPRLFALARCIELPLLRALPSGELASGLASSHITADGGKTWSFELRAPAGQESEPGYLGQHLIQHYKELLRGPDSPLRAQLADLLAGGKDYSQGRGTEISGLTLDGATLKVQLTRPYQQFPSWVSQPGLGVLLNRQFSQPPIAGLAPFGLSSVEGNVLILRPNPDALDGPPVLDELHFVCEPDLAAQVELFRGGALDAANVPWSQAAGAGEDEALKPALVRHETAGMLLALFDHHEFPWGDQEFQSKLGLRRALNYSLDLPLLAEAYGGQVHPWRHFIAPVFKDYLSPAALQQPTFPDAADLPAAGASLKAADHEQGNHLTPGMDLGYLRASSVDPHLVKEVLRFWRDVSIKMKPFPLTKDEQEVRVGRGTHEILLTEQRPAYPDVDAALYPLLHSALAGNGGNLMLLKNPEVDKALEAAQGTSSTVARQKTLQALCQLIEDQSLAVFIGNASPLLLISPKLGGLQLSPYDYDASLPAQDFARLGLKRD